ncbi:MAG: hypothetical protein D6731_09765 [Planctomycetota bacterium]|nr:MAG: hypothetical protein D6731_09765 [Planctomycetota bacterium]
MLARLVDGLRARLRPAAPPPEERGELLPFDLFLTTAAGSILLFPRGPIRPFVFFQREVHTGHRVEYLSRRDPGSGAEDYRPYGLIRLRKAEALTLVRPKQVQRLYETLTCGCGLRRIPPASSMTRAPFRTHCPGDPDDGSRGRNELRPPPHAQVRVRGGERIPYARVLELLGRASDPREAIAYLEDAFPEPLPSGRVVHRYYLGSNLDLYVVRHDPREGKRLYKAQTSAEAVEACLASGLYRRLRCA